VPPTVARAEQLLDEAALWTLAIGNVLARRARWLIERAREEMEDILAEAQALRSQWRSALEARQRRDH